MSRGIFQSAARSFESFRLMIPWGDCRMFPSRFYPKYTRAGANVTQQQDAVLPHPLSVWISNTRVKSLVSAICLVRFAVIKT